MNRHCAILRINKTSFQLEKIPLKTVRPFVMGNLVLEKVPGLKPSDKKGIGQCITQKVFKKCSFMSTDTRLDKRSL
jgi:double-strand break repair protein MRE11